MINQYFGQYLLGKGYLSVDQLKDALAYEKDTKVKLGILALNDGLMTVEQIEKVHQQQLQVDKKFGEIAVENGFLTEEQLEMLLLNQKKGHLLLGQCLLDKNYISLEDLNDAMIDYSKSQDLSVAVFEETQNETILNNFIDFGKTLCNQVYLDYVSLLLRNITRFIDDIPIVSVEKIENEYRSPWMVSQKISGKFSMFTSFSSDDDKALTLLAERFNKDRYDTFNEYAQDGVSEFLNLHNGIFLVNMSNKGAHLNMEPQIIETQVTLTDLQECFKIHLKWLWGSIYLVIH